MAHQEWRVVEPDDRYGWLTQSRWAPSAGDDWPAGPTPWRTHWPKGAGRWSGYTTRKGAETRARRSWRAGDVWWAGDRPEQVLSAEERARLAEGRERSLKAEFFEGNRLEFARWLVEHGKLNEQEV